MVDEICKLAISARSAGIIEITMAVYNFVLNEIVFYGDKETCEALEKTSTNLYALEL
jgi:hypothetical protein